jgi:hypothetical protein
MVYKSQWKCGNCGKEYAFGEFIQLTIIQAVESDTDPKREHGYICVCDCGYRFHIDTWRLHDDVGIDTDHGYVNIKVSTAFLEFNHGYDAAKNIWYETMLFPGGFGDDEVDWLKCSLVHRYETKEGAIVDHDKIVNLLKEGKFKIGNYPWEESKKELIIMTDENEET